jgi:hypothetical protein
MVPIPIAPETDVVLVPGGLNTDTSTVPGESRPAGNCLPSEYCPFRNVKQPKYVGGGEGEGTTSCSIADTFLDLVVVGFDCEEDGLVGSFLAAKATPGPTSTTG